MSDSAQPDGHRSIDPDKTFAVTEEQEYVEPPLNHLSPMGQVEAMGDFARGLGPRRARLIVRVGIIAALGLILASVVVR